MKRIVVAAGCAALACLSALTISSAAGAASSATFTAQRITGPGQPASGIDHNVVALGTARLKMPAHQTTYVVSALRANAATGRTMVDNEVRCTWPGGGKNMVLGQNVYAGTGDNPQWEDIWIVTKFLLHPAKAATVTCRTYARVASLARQPSSVRIAAGSLRFANKSVPNAANGKPLSYDLPYGDIAVDAKHPHVRQLALPTTRLSTRTKELNVFADVNYQVCQRNAVCNKRDSSTARFTLIVNQWNSTGKEPCRTDATTSVTRTVPYAVHHLVVPLYKPHFTVSKAHGCAPVFNAYVRVDWLRGERGALQGTAVGLPDKRGSASRHRSGMSHIYVVPA